MSTYKTAEDRAAEFMQTADYVLTYEALVQLLKEHELGAILLYTDRPDVIAAVKARLGLES